MSCDLVLCPTRAKLARQNQAELAKVSKDATPTLVDPAANATGSYTEALLAQSRERAAQGDERRIELCAYMWNKLQEGSLQDVLPFVKTGFANYLSTAVYLEMCRTYRAIIDNKDPVCQIRTCQCYIVVLLRRALAEDIRQRIKQTNTTLLNRIVLQSNTDATFTVEDLLNKKLNDANLMLNAFVKRLDNKNTNVLYKGTERHFEDTVRDIEELVKALSEVDAKAMEVIRKYELLATARLSMVSGISLVEEESKMGQESQDLKFATARAALAEAKVKDLQKELKERTTALKEKVAAAEAKVKALEDETARKADPGTMQAEIEALQDKVARLEEGNATLERAAEEAKARAAAAEVDRDYAQQREQEAMMKAENANARIARVKQDYQTQIDAVKAEARAQVRRLKIARDKARENAQKSGQQHSESHQQAWVLTQDAIQKCRAAEAEAIAQTQARQQALAAAAEATKRLNEAQAQAATAQGANSTSNNVQCRPARGFIPALKKRVAELEEIVAELKEEIQHLRNSGAEDAEFQQRQVAVDDAQRTVDAANRELGNTDDGAGYTTDHDLSD